MGFFKGRLAHKKGDFTGLKNPDNLFTFPVNLTAFPVKKTSFYSS
jgi:hypothetical protein